MICSKKDSFSRQWTDGFRRRAHMMQIPVSGSVALNHLCNMDCCHCYLSDGQRADVNMRSGDAIKNDIKEWVEAGCLYLLITGGEPMLHPDFVDIYRFACEQGLIVTVFCNGSMVGDEELAVFREFPPRKVEVSLYGASPEIHDRVTGVHGSHEEAWKGVHRLREAGIPLVLKTVLLTLNKHELMSMKGQAEKLDIPFRYDCDVFPRIADRQTKPVQYRVGAEESVAYDAADRARMQEWRMALNRSKDLHIDPNVLYSCGAGRTGFHCEPDGAYSPCLLLSHKYVYQRDAAETFGEIWSRMNSDMSEKRRISSLGEDPETIGLCTHCPAVNYLETGCEETASSFSLESVERRYDLLKESMKEEKS